MKKFIGYSIFAAFLMIPLVLALVYPHGGWPVLVGLIGFVMNFIPGPKSK